MLRQTAGIPPDALSYQRLLGRDSTQGEALASIRESIELEQAARCEILHKTIGAVNSEIIRIEVADTA